MRCGVLGGGSAAQVVRVAAWDAELLGVDLAASDVAVDDLAHEVRAGRRELVDPAGAVHDVGAPGAEPREDVGDHRHELR